MDRVGGWWWKSGTGTGQLPVSRGRDFESMQTTWPDDGGWLGSPNRNRNPWIRKKAVPPPPCPKSVTSNLWFQILYAQHWPVMSATCHQIADMYYGAKAALESLMIASYGIAAPCLQPYYVPDKQMLPIAFRAHFQISYCVWEELTDIYCPGIDPQDSLYAQKIMANKYYLQMMVCLAFAIMKGCPFISALYELKKNGDWAKLAGTIPAAGYTSLYKTSPSAYALLCPLDISQLVQLGTNPAYSLKSFSLIGDEQFWCGVARSIIVESMAGKYPGSGPLGGPNQFDDILIELGACNSWKECYAYGPLP